MAQKSILITGCSSGIGEYSALALHKAGWNVFATARKDEDLKRLSDAGLQAIYLDYCEPQSIESCANKVLSATQDNIFALFNNGAYGQPGAVEDLTPEALKEQFEANFFGWHDLTARLLPAMRKQGSGRIIQCSSVLGLTALKYRGAYVSSKYAVEGLSDAMRLELDGTGIYVSLIEPGPIETKFAINALAKFNQFIDVEASPHAQDYKDQLERLEKGGTDSRFKLGCDAVHVKLLRALESPTPKARYFVTVPTYLLAGFKRALPDRIMDKILIKASY